MVTKYGVIGDIHGTDTPLDQLVDKMVTEGVDAFVLNGDIGDNKEIMYNTLKTVGATKKPVYVQPGSHERVLDYLDTLTKVQDEYSNIIDIVSSDDKIFVEDDYNLLFMPGSDRFAGGQFIETDSAESGLYVFLGDEYVEILPSDIEEIREFGGLQDDLFYISNPASLEGKLKDKDHSRTIAFNHVPSRFDKDSSVDYGHYYNIAEFRPAGDNKVAFYNQVGVAQLESKDQLEQQGVKIIEYSEDNSPEKIQKRAFEMLKKEGCSSFAIESKDNTGSELLKSFYNDYNIKKVINNHIHEASHNAHDLAGNIIALNTDTPTLFYNAGCASDNKAGLLTVDGENVQYKNIDLN